MLTPCNFRFAGVFWQPKVQNPCASRPSVSAAKTFATSSAHDDRKFFYPRSPSFVEGSRKSAFFGSARWRFSSAVRLRFRHTVGNIAACANFATSRLRPMIENLSPFMFSIPEPDEGAQRLMQSDCDISSVPEDRKPFPFPCSLRDIIFGRNIPSGGASPPANGRRRPFRRCRDFPPYRTSPTRASWAWGSGPAPARA